jgi:hypothetical protein
MKNILSISDIQSILGPLTKNFFGASSKIKLEDIYQDVFEVGEKQAMTLSKEVVKMFEKSKTAFPKSREKGKGKEDDFLQIFSFVCMLCFDVYMKKQLIEKIIDDNFSNHKEDKKT